MLNNVFFEVRIIGAPGFSGYAQLHKTLFFREWPRVGPIRKVLSEMGVKSTQLVEGLANAKWHEDWTLQVTIPGCGITILIHKREFTE